MNSETGEIFLPVYGLYADFTNTVTLTYHFNDGSSKEDCDNRHNGRFRLILAVTTNPTVLQARTETTSLEL